MSSTGKCKVRETDPEIFAQVVEDFGMRVQYGQDTVYTSRADTNAIEMCVSHGTQVEVVKNDGSATNVTLEDLNDGRDHQFDYSLKIHGDGLLINAATGGPVGLIWMTPSEEVPTESDIAVLYGDRYYDRYNITPEIEQALKSKKAEKIAQNKTAGYRTVRSLESQFRSRGVTDYTMNEVVSNEQELVINISVSL